ncbi:MULTISPECIES: hypothetical protein [Rhizobium/Agrobacterium group]|uniref:DUF4365 domain-containing protein n=2 Tax=Rhizobium/Agrobacterium group TaxID=227290 RepID=B9JRZ0_ALLAM|nr:MULTISPECIES: hypothetical protein [Rhizobium/Agrobacterium group]ACM37618.1 hypothetical protein Avi_3635 [Allorhizobium ampelinum S4]MCF1447651.1 hypothetical protein [Allorhizobium ampelinum]MUO30477.1 hypothetical protein [Agrobacterium vitis]MUO43454.1 hypothetical protein [Agrobacterium vitis]MUP11590.1 hypothetical protein [Agrobacterium vitis]
MITVNNKKRGSAQSVDEGLDNDRIGRLGEAEFVSLCERAKLSCSKVEPDRTGKDFIVEFAPPALEKGQSFDCRPAPLQFAVQVKTIRSHKKTVSVSLSVAERLARDLRPAVICVLKIDSTDKFVSMHLIHIKDEVLGRVLKRLRLATGSPKALNKQNINFTSDVGNRIDYSGPALNVRLKALVDSGMKSYADEKSRQIEELGFNEVRVLGKLSFQHADSLSLADTFLGLASLEGVSITITERRFEIDLPLALHVPPGKLTVTPEPACKAAVEFSNADERVSVDADVYLPPKDIFFNGGKKVVFAWPMGRVTIALNDKKNCKYTENISSSEQHTAKEWLNGLLVSEIFGSGSLNISVTLLDGRSLMKASVTNEQMPSRMGIINLIRRYLDILTFARAPDIPIKLDVLFEQRETIDETWQYLQGDMMATFSLENSLVEPEDQDGIYITALQIGDGRVFGLAVPMSVSFAKAGRDAQANGKIEPQSATIELLQEPVVASYEHFTEKVTRLNRSKLRILRSLYEEGDVQSDLTSCS